MANTVEWASHEAIATALTTELNALANGSLSTASANIANHTDLYRYITFFLSLASLTPASGAYLNVYILYSKDDGTTWADASTANVFAVKATMTPSTSTGAKELAFENVPIAPFDFKLVVENECGVALAASGSTLKYARHNEQIV